MKYLTEKQKKKALSQGIKDKAENIRINQLSFETFKLKLEVFEKQLEKAGEMGLISVKNVIRILSFYKESK
jgi:indole-3-glycerol phosphate synthase